MSTERPETSDEVRRVIGEAAAEVSRKFFHEWLERAPDDPVGPSCKLMAEAFEAFADELER